MENYACAFSQSESGKYFESIIKEVTPLKNIFLKKDKLPTRKYKHL